MSGASEEYGDQFDSAELEIIERERAEGRVLESLPPAPEPVETKDQRRMRLSREHHEAILAGKVDIGPITEHEHITEDIRDLRHPTELGRVLLNDDLREDAFLHSGSVKRIGLHEVFDFAEKRGLLDVPRFPGDETSVAEAVRTRRAELEARAAEGDKFAISMLTTGKPGDSDE